MHVSGNPIRRVRLAAASLLFASLSQAGDAHNYAKALQMSNYFFECQESGALSPGNRCPWRGPAHTRDGQEVGRDLSGGWYDAGDHWKSNSTMGFSAWMLAWSGITWPEAYETAGQMDELLNNLAYVCDYFLKCVVDPHPNDMQSFEGYEIYIDVGGKPGPEPGVHSVWASPEVIEGYTVREALKGNAEVPPVDVAGNMASALAAGAILFAEYGDAEQQEYAARLLKVARKMATFQDRFFPAFFSGTLKDGQCLGVAPNGTVRPIAYRDKDPYPYCVLSFAWLHRAERALGTPDYEDEFLDRALFYESEMVGKNPGTYAWWRSHVPKYAAMALLAAEPALPEATKSRLEAAVGKLVRIWAKTNPSDPTGVVASPGGLHYRKNQAEAFTISILLKATALCAYWSEYQTDEGKPYVEYARSQMDYILGDNPTGRSYMIGYDGDGSGRYWKVVHHRGAYGAWRSFEHFVKGTPEYRPDAVRHTLYGGVLLGNNAPNDSFRAKVMHHSHTEVAIYANAAAQSVLACLIANGLGDGRPVPDDEFPPKAVRNNNTDPYTTDREFFVIGRLQADGDDATRIEAALHNRTRWPARRTAELTFRYHFTLDADTPRDRVRTELHAASVPARIGSPQWLSDDGGFVEISFPDDTIGPFKAGDEKRWSNHRTVSFTIGTPGKSTWDRANDWSGRALTAEQAVIPCMPVFEAGLHVGGECPNR